MKLTMEDTCLNCGRKQGTDEPYIYEIYTKDIGKKIIGKAEDLNGLKLGLNFSGLIPVIDRTRTNTSKFKKDQIFTFYVIGDILEHVHPWAVDISSGVETDGRKCLSKIKIFLENVKKSAHQHKHTQKQNYSPTGKL